MDEIFARLTGFVEENLFVGVLLISLLGSFWGVMAEISQNLQRNQAIDLNDLPAPQFRLSLYHCTQLALPCLSLTIVNVVFSIIFYFLFLLIFWVLNQLFENIWIQLIIAFSITRAINRKQANVSFINAYLGGFDLNDIPIFKNFVNSLIENYEIWTTKQCTKTRDIIDTIYREQAKEELITQAKEAAKKLQDTQEILKSKTPEELLQEIKSRIDHWPDPQYKQKLNQDLVKIETLTDKSERQGAIVDLYQKVIKN
ncbi:MAG: hypothetical protein GC158_09745 [Cyanobacteria bacterium RI_101]|nr:hypothetical protein [Cyanobacteria bacterium RI_101]